MEITCSRDSRTIDERAHRAVLWMSWFVAVLSFVGCSLAPPRGPPHHFANSNDAAEQFSLKHYCPLYRVRAEPIERIPLAPASIAADGERYAMWREAALSRAGTQHFTLLDGCGERAVYKCWSGFSGEACMEEASGALVVQDESPPALGDP
jgi:hypothetical protein